MATDRQKIGCKEARRCEPRAVRPRAYANNRGEGIEPVEPPAKLMRGFITGEGQITSPGSLLLEISNRYSYY
jgi:hypothetical protein